MQKKAVVFLMVLLIAMTSVSSYCFCAHETATNAVSFQRSHQCCDSNVMSHCGAHVDKACQTERQEELSLPSLKLQTDPEAILAFSFMFQPELHQTASLFFTEFPNFQESLFLKNEVLRI